MLPEQMNDVSNMDAWERYKLAKTLSEKSTFDPEFVRTCLAVQPLAEIEVFCRIPGWENYYMVSNLGRIFSIPRAVPTGAIMRNTRPRIVRQNINSTGYANILLNKNNKGKTGLVSRLVAKAFIPKTEEDIRLGRDDVDHISGIKLDNRVCNLRWLTRGENKNAAILTGFIHQKITPEIYDQLVHDYTVLKMTTYELSDKYQICRMAICNALFGRTFRPFGRPTVQKNNLSRAGRIKPWHRLSKEKIQEIRSMYSDGIRQVDIAKKFGIDDGTVCKIIHNPNYPRNIKVKGK